MAIPLFLCCAILGHELPDGRYDRGIQVLVSPDSIQVTYELTATDATLRREIAKNHYDVVRLQGVIARGLNVELNGVPKHLQAQAVHREKRHHAKVIFTYELPSDRRDTHADLVLRDNTFPGCDGCVRLAITGRDGVVVKHSNAASTLRRATPRTLNALSAVERTKVARLTAILTTESPTPIPHRHVGYTVVLVGAIACALIVAARWRLVTA